MKTRIPKFITREWLQRRFACPAALRVFKRNFPKRTLLTIENIKKFEKLQWHSAEWLLGELGISHQVFCSQCAPGKGSLAKGYAALRKLGVPQK
jgi:hypothetical protein